MKTMRKELRVRRTEKRAEMYWSMVIYSLAGIVAMGMFLYSYDFVARQ
jgi:hypothetical protein